MAQPAQPVLPQKSQQPPKSPLAKQFGTKPVGILKAALEGAFAEQRGRKFGLAYGGGPGVSALGSVFGPVPRVRIRSLFSLFPPPRPHGFVEWSGGGGGASAAATFMQRSTSSGAYAIFNGARPPGEIKLDVTPAAGGTGAKAIAQITVPGPSGQTVTIDSQNFSPSAPAGNSINVSAWSPGKNGGSYLSLALDGQSSTAAALGVIYNQSGATVVGTAPKGWTTQTTRQAVGGLSSGQALRIGGVVETRGDWQVRPYLSLNYSNSDQNMAQDVGYNLTPSGGASTLPGVTLGQSSRLKSDWVGAAVGAAFSGPIGGGWKLSLGLDAGRGQMSGQLNSYHSVAVAGSGSQVNGGPAQGYSAMGWTGRATLAVSRPVARNTTFSMGIFSNYFSSAPTVVTTTTSAPSAVSSSASGTGVGYTGDGATTTTQSVDFRPISALGLALGVTYLF